jgi:hypothetical protein
VHGSPNLRVLPLWFAICSAAAVAQLTVLAGTDWFGLDLRIYLGAAEKVLAGGDPWSAKAMLGFNTFHFAGLPTSAMAFVPLVFIPVAAAMAIYLLATLWLTVVGLRRIGLPAWWLLFPPYLVGLLSGNPGATLLGLLLAGSPLLRGLAAPLKIQGLVPMIARRDWRGISIAALVFGGSAVVAPGLWGSYVANFGRISARLVEESKGGFSATQFLDPTSLGPVIGDGVLGRIVGLLIFAVIAGLVLLAAIRNVPAAGWIAVPLLMPGSEYHYAELAMPAARRISIMIVAIPTAPTYLFGLLLLAYEVAAGRQSLADERPVGMLEWLRELRRRHEG